MSAQDDPGRPPGGSEDGGGRVYTPISSPANSTGRQSGRLNRRRHLRTESEDDATTSTSTMHSTTSTTFDSSSSFAQTPATERRYRSRHHHHHPHHRRPVDEDLSSSEQVSDGSSQSDDDDHDHDEEEGRRSGYDDASMDGPRRRRGRKQRSKTKELDESSTLELRHQEINRLFGFKKWKGHVRHKTLDERSGAIKQLLLDQDIVDPAALAAGKGLDEEMGHFVRLEPGPGAEGGDLRDKPTWRQRATRCWEPSYSNYIWAATFGWMMALVYALVGGIMMLTWVGRQHGRLALAMARYWLWPFQKYVCARRGMERYLTIAEDRVASINNNHNHNHNHNHQQLDGSSYTSLRNETDPLVVRSGTGALDEDPSIIVGSEPFSPSSSSSSSSSFGWASVSLWLHSLRPSEPITAGYVIWLVLWFLVLAPVHLLVWFFTWETVLLIPMAKVAMRLLKYSYYKPLSLQIERDYPGADRDVLVCCFKAANHYYYKYSVFGMNIILVNLLPFVLISLFVGYVSPGEEEVPPAVLTVLTLISAVPLTYYIGSAVSSLSAQATPAVGAVLNATFGSVVDLIVYFLAISKGSLNGLVTAGVTGSLLGMMLLTPGLCMLAGGLKYRQQRFSSAAAGVSIVLLFVSLIGAFIPTIFYNLFGARTLACQECVVGLPNSTEIFYPVMNFRNGRTASFAVNDSSIAVGRNFTDWSCNFCIWGYTNIDDDPIYRDKARILQYIVAAIMPIAYVVGLLFTLKTHTHIYEIEPDPHDADGEEGGHGGHDAPEWNKLTAFVILLSATTLFALIAEELVNSLDGTLTALGISPAFAGLTIIALITNLSEIVNAIRFSLQNDFALALEIGTGCSIQIFLLQMPLLVLFSALYNHGSATDSFTLIFPWLDVVAVTLALLVVNYISIDGKANYFTGSALTITYIILIVAFAYAPDWSATVV